MKKHPVFWIMKQMGRRIPALILLTVSQVGQALFSVFFALGSSAVIDSAASGDRQAFWSACLFQAGIITGILVCTTMLRHLREKLKAAMEQFGVKSFDNDLVKVTNIAASTTTRIDSAALKKKYPAIAEECSKVSNTSAYIKIEVKE